MNLVNSKIEQDFVCVCVQFEIVLSFIRQIETTKLNNKQQTETTK